MSEACDVLSYRLGDTSEVYSLIKPHGYNVLPYLAYCQYCKYQITIALPAARCVKCDSSLIKYIAHNELAGSDS